MSDDLQVVTVPDADTVAVPQPAVEVLTETVTTPIVIEAPETEVVVLDDTVHVVEAIHDMSVVSVGEQGPQGAPGISLGGETYVAGQDLGGHRVTVANSSGELIYAENTDSTHADQAARITTQAASSGDDIIVQTSGKMSEVSWAWTPGAALYVGTNGLMTHTVPASPAVFSKIIAVAETATSILIVNFPPVILA